MGSDVQWQIDNGYGREVMGDFSTGTPQAESPLFGHYFDTFQAASHVAKTFPGSTLEPSEYVDKTGTRIRHYYVDSQPYVDQLSPEQADDFLYDDYPAAVHFAECIDQASTELEALLSGGRYSGNDDGHASPTILEQSKDNI
ncbi:MAG TPA: hypothetical protein VJS14_13300 [Enterobacteriaceae bacterium]|nr:hypothetical protein [Enterobacteriaceae bacterium]